MAPRYGHDAAEQRRRGVVGVSLELARHPQRLRPGFVDGPSLLRVYREESGDARGGGEPEPAPAGKT